MIMDYSAHISEEQWFLLLSKNADLQKKRELLPALLLHISECSECKALYERARSVQYTARRFSFAAGAARTMFSETNAYRQVASDQGNTISSQKAGRLGVCIETGPDNAVFLQDTFEEEGIARKYALNFENGNTYLCDDENLLSLHLSGKHLSLDFNDPCLLCQFLLTGEDGTSQSGMLLSVQDPVPVEISPGCFYILEIFFEEKNF